MLGLMQDWPLLCHRIIDHAGPSTARKSSPGRSRADPTTNYRNVRAAR